MQDNFKRFLAVGAGNGSSYSLCLRQGMFEGGAGGRLGARSGSSLEFMEHRDYMPGDDLRTLDWNVYARTEKLTVKLFREEINPRLDMIIDGSASMNLEGSKKAEAALGLAGILAVAAANASFQTRAWIMNEEFTPVINGGGPIETWDGIDFSGAPDFSHAANTMGGNLFHHGVRIVISDLLWMMEPKHYLHKVCAGAAAVIIIQVMGREDLCPEEYGNIRLTDSETGLSEELFVDAAALRKYQETLNNHQDNWYRACRENGAWLITFEAESLAEKWDMEPLIRQEIIQVI